MNPAPSGDRIQRAALVSDVILVILTVLALVMSMLVGVLPASTALPITFALVALSFAGLIPVAWSAGKSLARLSLSVDLLASIALIFSLISQEWKSAALINLMLAFARIFEAVTEARVKRVMQSLMKFAVETVRVKHGEAVHDISVKDVRPGDLVVVESGDRMPVDGVIVEGTADIDESSLTGESELVQKKVGDRVSTATVNESGSLTVRTERVGADTTLSRIVALVEESSRAKNKAERMADRFTQWYIGLSLLAALVMYLVGLSLQEILAVLLVVCADDIAVAVPLAFTASIARAARRGVIIKGSSAMESLAHLRYILTDKTGTLTRGVPRVSDIKAYGSFSAHKVLELGLMASSESKHMVSRAIAEYALAQGMAIHAPHEYEEIPGKGVRFRHGIDRMLLGRLTFLESEGVRVPVDVRRDIETEKDAGRGIALISVNGSVAGLVAYHDELRPHVREVIAETRVLGVREWHMLTGDNEHAAAAVASELGLRHYHANMTPETKVALVRRFEEEHKPAVVGYIGDGVNDAASLALADVSIAMGGIGADAALEAADITIMKDRLSRLPEAIRMAQSVMFIMWENFGIWGATNVVGLFLVGCGVIGPVGAAAYNFLTDFIPIGNALRAGRKRLL